MDELEIFLTSSYTIHERLSIRNINIAACPLSFTLIRRKELAVQILAKASVLSRHIIGVKITLYYLCPTQHVIECIDSKKLFVLLILIVEFNTTNIEENASRIIPSCMYCKHDHTNCSNNKHTSICVI